MGIANLPRIAVCFEIALLCLLVEAAAAQDVPAPPHSVNDAVEEMLEEVVVVANKDERPVRAISANVTVISRAQLRDELAASFADVFRYSPGVDYEASGSRFGTEGINIRGISGNRVALVLDGVPLSEQFSIGRFSNATRDFIEAGLVQRVEVLHGPASALYGSSAIGGVVAMRTPDPQDIAARGGVGGDVALTRQNADDSVQLRALTAAVGASHEALLGVSVREGHEMESAVVSAAGDSKDYRRRAGIANINGENRFGHGWRFGALHQDASTQTQLRSMLGSGRFRSTTRLDGDDRFDLNLASIEYDSAAADSAFDKLLTRVFVQHASFDQRTLDERGAAARPVVINRRFEYAQRIAGFEFNAQRTFAGESAQHRLGMGVQWSRHETRELRDGNELGLLDGVYSTTVLGEQFPLRDFPLTETWTAGAYLEDTLSIANWTVIGALRAEHYELSADSDAIFRDDNPHTQPVSLAVSSLAPKLGVIYRARPAMDVYFQYAHGFRAPPFQDVNIGFDIPLFNYRALPNPDLEAERSNSFELGLRHVTRGTRAHVGVFYSHYDDLIESRVRLGVDPVSGALLFQSQNVQAATIGGLEASWQRSLSGRLRAFDLSASAYWARGENKQTGEPLNSVGPARAVVGVRWAPPGGKTSLLVRGVVSGAWSRRDESRGELFSPAGHGVIDAYLTHRISPRVTARASVRNVTDRTYWSASDVGGLGPDDPVLAVLARPPRNLSLSLDVTW